MPDFIHRWLEYTPKFTEDAARISYLGLLTLLAATIKDMEIAGI